MAARSESEGRARIGNIYKEKPYLRFEGFIDRLHELDFFGKRKPRDWSLQDIKTYCQKEKIATLKISSIEEARFGCDFIKYSKDRYFYVADFFEKNNGEWLVKRESVEHLKKAIKFLKDRDKIISRVFSCKDLPEGEVLKISNLKDAREGCDFIKYGKDRYFYVKDFFEEKDGKISLSAEKEQEFRTIIGIIEDINYFTSSEFKGRKIDETKDDSYLSRKKQEEERSKSEPCLAVSLSSEVLSASVRLKNKQEDHLVT